MSPGHGWRLHASWEEHLNLASGQLLLAGTAGAWMPRGRNHTRFAYIFNVHVQWVYV